VPQEPQRDMEFVFVENVQQVFSEALLPSIAPPPVTNGKRSIKTTHAKKASSKPAKRIMAKKR
jgi:hypothetical protein